MALNPAGMKIALLAGGTSGEREISLASGKGAQRALVEAGFEVVVLDPARREDLALLVEEHFDAAFLCLHGKGGEDGTMQGMLSILGIPFTGPGVWSSATAIDKAKSKVFYQRAGIPTPASLVLSKPDQLAEAIAFADEHAWPVVVKPSTEGSALGVYMPQNQQELKRALDDALALDREVLVEQYVAGTEITVAVLGNDCVEALPVIQIVPRNDFYDFDAKYAPGGSQHLCPAPIDEALTARAQELGVAAHRALCCRGMSRTDMIIDKNEQLWVLETNTIPGMTPTSLLPDAAWAAGISFPQLCTRLVEYALENS